MELREEAWSPGPLDSEDQQMASHENPGEGPCASPGRPHALPAPWQLGARLRLRGPASRLPGLVGSLRPPSREPLGVAPLASPGGGSSARGGPGGWARHD